MKKAVCLFAVVAWVVGTQAVRAAEAQKQPDQTMVLEGTPDGIAIPSQLLADGNPLSPNGLAQPVVVSLIADLVRAARGMPAYPIGAEPAPSPCTDGTLAANTDYMLHLVKHDRGEPGSRNNAWYVFSCSWIGMSPRERLNDPDFASHFREARLFGATRLSFLYLHYGVPLGVISEGVMTTSMATDRVNLLPAAIPGSEAVSKARLKAFWDRFENANPGIALRNPRTGDPAPLDFGPTTTFAALRTQSEAELRRLAPILSRQWIEEFNQSGERITSLRGKRLVGVLGAPDTPTRFVEEDFLPISYRIDILKKNPIWRDNLKAVASQFGLQAGSITGYTLPMTVMALFGHSLDNQINYPTSDVTATGIRGKAEQAGEEGRLIATKAYDNEKKYRFDFGFAMPLKAVKELTFNSESQLVQPKPVEKNRFFGTVSLFPLGPVDTKASKLLRLTPELIYGMALDKRPWDHHLIAFGLGLKWAQPFFGVTGTRLTIAADDGALSGYRWGWRLSYGVKVPVNAITNLIKKESK